MKRAEPGVVLLWNGELMRVIAVTDRRTITLAKPNELPCVTCGVLDRVHVVEDSPLWQNNARPVQDLGR